MIRKNWYLLLVLFIIMVSCKKEPTLSESELNIIKNKIPESLYKAALLEVNEPVYNYLWEGIKEYADQVQEEVERKINQNNVASALFGGNIFDIGELFGTSDNRLYANQYYSYIEYANKHNQDLYNLIESLTEIISEDPSILRIFNETGWETESLTQFSGIKYMPSSISWNTFQQYENHELDNHEQVWWGKMIMGSSRHPAISGSTAFYIIGKIMSQIEYPHLVYAVYDEETKSWDVGYDNEEAFNIAFTKREDIIHYDYNPASFSQAYINSKLNYLNKPKK